MLALRRTGIRYGRCRATRKSIARNATKSSNVGTFIETWTFLAIHVENGTSKIEATIDIPVTNAILIFA